MTASRRAFGRSCLGAAFAAALLAGACVSEVVDDGAGDRLDLAIRTRSVVIPIATGMARPGPLSEFYEGIFARLHEAHQERDLLVMESLLRRYEREDLPAAVARQLLGFRALTNGLEFELHAAANARLERQAPRGAQPESSESSGPSSEQPVSSEEIGSVLVFELVLPPLPGRSVQLGGHSADDAVAFGVDIRIRDHFLDGSSRTHEDGDILVLPETVLLADEPLRLPLELDLGPSAAVKRELDLRVDLLPGYIGTNDLRVPVRRMTLAARSDTQWPKGLLMIRDKPLQVLRAAMAIGDTRHFVHVRLSAEFAPAKQRPAVHEALIDWVRLGKPDQAAVAMATLAATTDARVAIGDRDGWLAWWQAQR